MRVTIHQPNYAPWCGFFAKISICDVFVVLDDVQMSKNSYTNRSQILVNDVRKWLTVPVSFSLGDPILSVKIADPKWVSKHCGLLESNYHSAPCFSEIMPMLATYYSSKEWTNIAGFNSGLIRLVLSYLNIKKEIVLSSELAHTGAGDERLISILKLLGATTYISGKGGQKYQDPKKFDAAGVSVEVCEYSPVKYKQYNENFEGGLSILDALFHMGKRTIELLKY